jgi:hypothetical protein
MMLLDGVVGMSTALDVYSSGMRYVDWNYGPNKSVATLGLARTLAGCGNLSTPAAGTVPACRGLVGTQFRRVNLI